jgi:hypothetical protein
MAVTKSALHEDGMASYEICMFRKECGWDSVLLPKMVGGKIFEIFTILPTWVLVHPRHQMCPVMKIARA